MSFLFNWIFNWSGTASSTSESRPSELEEGHELDHGAPSRRTHQTRGTSDGGDALRNPTVEATLVVIDGEHDAHPPPHKRRKRRAREEKDEEDKESPPTSSDDDSISSSASSREKQSARSDGGAQRATYSSSRISQIDVSERCYLVDRGANSFFIVHNTCFVSLFASTLVEGGWRVIHQQRPIFHVLPLWVVRIPFRRRPDYHQRREEARANLFALLRVAEADARMLSATQKLRADVSAKLHRLYVRCPPRPIQGGSPPPPLSVTPQTSPYLGAPATAYPGLILPVKQSQDAVDGDEFQAIPLGGGVGEDKVHHRHPTREPSGTGQRDQGSRRVAKAAGESDNDEDSGDGKNHKHRLERKRQREVSERLTRYIQANPQLRFLLSMPAADRTQYLRAHLIESRTRFSSGAPRRVTYSHIEARDHAVTAQDMDRLIGFFTDHFNALSRRHADGAQTVDEESEDEVNDECYQIHHYDVSNAEELIKYTTRCIFRRPARVKMLETLQAMADQFQIPVAEFVGWFVMTYLLEPSTEWKVFDLHMGFALLSRSISGDTIPAGFQPGNVDAGKK